MKKISTILIIMGLLIASYPVANNLYTGYQQKRLISSWEADLDIENNYRQLNEAFTQENQNPTVVDEPTEEPVEEPLIKPDSPPQKNVMGTIEINKINVHLPVLKGTSESTLKKGAGHMTQTSLPGEVGNSAIAAHRGHSYGRLFNRLDELEIGDKVTVTTQDGKFIYTVYEKKVVEPTDLSVLKGNDEERVLTLITCTPLYEATHRLIIHAKME